MLLSVRAVALAALITISHASTARNVPDGPDKLAECTSCEPISKAMVKCQKIEKPGGVGDEIKNCICIPNSNPDAWYGYIHKCRDCLSPGNNEFYGNLASMITQLFTSCTNAGGNVFSDGNSICATNAMWSICASLKDGSDGELSWASFERFSDPSQNSNATQILNIEVPKDSESSTTSSIKSTASHASTGATTAATENGSPSQAPATATTDSPGATTTTTDTPSSTASPTTNPAARLNQRPQAGYAVGMLAAVGLIGVLV